MWSRPLSGGRWAAILYNKNLIWGEANVTLTFTPDILPGWPASATKATVRVLFDLLSFLAFSFAHPSQVLTFDFSCVMYGQRRILDQCLLSRRFLSLTSP